MSQTVDELMGFDPTNLEVFQEKPKNNGNPSLYRTNPSLSKSEDGHYRSRVKVIYNPHNVKQSVVNQATYAMNDTEGFFMVKSMLGNGDRNCPIFKGWKKLWFSGDDVKKEWARKMFDKSETQWVLVQIMEDDNQPDLVGQIRCMKLPKAIFTKMSAKMNPSPESKKAPQPIMDYLIGLPLDIDVTPGPDDPKNPSRKQREISYDLCEFGTDYEPITKVDGTPLFSEQELEVIDAFVTAKTNVSKAKTEAAKKKATEEYQAAATSIKPLYQKALTYLKDEAKVLDLEKECAYQPWDEATTARVENWLKLVLDMRDPKTSDVEDMFTAKADSAPEAAMFQAAGGEPTVSDPFESLTDTDGVPF